MDARVLARAAVFAWYGTECACCGASDDLTIDHIGGNGREHREELFGRQLGGPEFYLWLVRNGFPPGYQTLCGFCNSSKGRREGCTLRHDVPRPDPIPNKIPDEECAEGLAAMAGWSLPFRWLAAMTGLRRPVLSSMVGALCWRIDEAPNKPRGER